MTLSRFQEVVEGIRQAYHSLQSEFELPLLNNTGVEQHWCVGRVATKSHKTPPYVCWVRGGGTIAPPIRNGQVIVDADSLDPLYDASTAIVCVIAGLTEEQTENIWYGILLAARTVLHTAAGPQDFRWVTQEEDEAGLVNAGVEVVIQNFLWPFIVPSELKRTVTILETSHTDQLHGAAGGTHTDGSHT